MPITASCGNCGKTYQAPDHMAGKRVRCKECGEIFRIDAAELPTEPTDLDELERSLGGEALDSSAGTMSGTSAGTRMGAASGAGAGGRGVPGRPQVDEHGRSRIERTGDADAFAIAGGGANAMRSNYRYRYAGAKQIDQFLPWVLLVATLFLVSRAALTGYASGEDAPTTGVGVSRLVFLLVAYLIIVFPICHIALTMATTRLRVSMPRASLWRSFAGFTPVLMLGGGLFAFSGGQLSALVMGLFVGAVVCVGAITLLFRLFPTEVPTASGYIAGGAIIGGGFAAAVLFAINLVAAAAAGMDKNPTLFTSPIGVGLKWVDKPAVVAAVPRKTNETPSTNTTPGATQPEVTLPDNGLAVMPLPRTDGELFSVASRIELPPVRPGFDQILVPPVASNALAILRDASGGIVECWDRSTWKTTKEPGRGFARSQGPLAINTNGTLIERLVRNPTDRLENIPLGNADVLMPINFTGEGVRTLIGFENESSLLVRVSNSGAEISSFAIERYDVSKGKRIGDAATPFVHEGEPLSVRSSETSVRFLQKSAGVLIAGITKDGTASVPVLMLFRPDNLEAPTLRRVPWRDPRTFAPVALSAAPSGKTALLLNSDGEAYLTVWDMTGTRESPLLDRSLGPIDALRPSSWSNDTDPILWLDDQTLLLYGTYVIDANNGKRIGSPLRLDGIAAAYPASEEGLALILIRPAGLSTLTQVRFDMQAIRKATGR